jgi:ABC-type multidrug transport system fused ATPase/permease subunit
VLTKLCLTPARTPLLDALSKEGNKFENVSGDIEVSWGSECHFVIIIIFPFSPSSSSSSPAPPSHHHRHPPPPYPFLHRMQFDVEDFAYPARPENRVCDHYRLSVKAGETCALVGPSGSGAAVQMLACHNVENGGF